MTRSDLARCHAVSGHFDAVIGIMMERGLKKSAQEKNGAEANFRTKKSWMGDAPRSTVSIVPCGRCSGLEPLFQNPGDSDSNAELSGFAGDLSHKGSTRAVNPQRLWWIKPWSFPASEQAIPVRHYAGRMRLPVMSPFGVLWISHILPAKTASTTAGNYSITIRNCHHSKP